MYVALAGWPENCCVLRLAFSLQPPIPKSLGYGHVPPDPGLPGTFIHSV